MTTPNIEAAKTRLDRSIANQRELRKRIARSASELRGEDTEPTDEPIVIAQESVDINAA